MRIALSNDGSQLVYVGGDTVDRLYLRRLDDLTPTRLPGTENALDPQFSPDGRWIGFVVGNTLKKIAVLGGPPISIAESGRRFTWGDGDVIVMRASAGLWRVSAAGGRAERVTNDSSTNGAPHWWPHFLPDGKALLFNVGSPSDSAEVAAVRLADGKVMRLGIFGVNPRYLASGHVAFTLTNGTVMAAPFDARSLRVTGPGVPALEDVIVRGGGAAQFTVARNGTVVYLTGKTETQLVETDRAGRSTVLLAKLQGYAYPRFSPDGRRIALGIGRPGSAVNQPLRGSDVWILDRASATLSRLTNDEASFAPSWTPDGRRVLWTASPGGGRDEIRWQPWDASGPVESLLDDAQAGDVSPSGGAFIAAVGLGRGRAEKVMVSLESARRTTPLPGSLEFGLRPTPVPGSREVALPRISPDGRWLAYQSAQSGIPEVYVQPISGPGERHQISVDGGTEPRRHALRDAEIRGCRESTDHSVQLAQ